MDVADRDRIAQKAEARLAQIIASAMIAAADQYEATGRVDVPQEHYSDVSAAFLAIWGEAIRSAGRSVTEDFKTDFGLETKQDTESFFDRIVSLFAEMFGGRKITMVSDRTREQVRDMVLAGQRRGKTGPEIAREIREAIPEASRTRAAIIARTETHGSSNFAVHEMAKTSRRPMMKEWVAVEDSRTRDFGEGDGVVDEYSHRALHGVRVPVDQPFDVPDRRGGTAKIMFPGDPNGPAGAIINCRCVLAYVRAE